jgi:hypothetical protein
MGQFGKNPLGDCGKHLPTVHGFDDFFGKLCHPEYRGRTGRLLVSKQSGDQKEVLLIQRTAQTARGHKCEDAGPLTRMAIIEMKMYAAKAKFTDKTVIRFRWSSSSISNQVGNI